MDLQNEANYKFYKCRSLLACDSGGMVYDRSKSFDSRNNAEQSTQCASSSQCEAGLSEKIIYVVNSENESKANSRSLVDLTTHLDDDEFNDYEMKTNVKEFKNVPAHHLQCRNKFKFLDVENTYSCCGIVPNDLDNNTYNVIDGILEHEDNVIIHYSQLSPSFNESTNLSYCESVSDTIQNGNSSTEDILKIQANLQYELDPHKIAEVESYRNQMIKSKQMHNAKEDGYRDLLNCTKNAQQNLVPNNKSKKKKLAYNKENQRERLQSQKKNPFANVRMSSILKGKRAIKKTKSSFKEQASESMIPNCEENIASNSSCSYDDEILICTKSSFLFTDCSSSNSKDDVLQEQDIVVQLNSDLSNANYLDYVQPREQIIESDMDKLLTPTIENEFSEKNKNQSVNEIKRLIDCNGNEIDFQDIQNMKSSKSVLSPSPIVERELFLYSAYAKKLGMENLFNTSNDAIISEFIYGTNAVSEQINLELNCIENIEEVHLKQCITKNSFLKTVSCSLLESLNELNRFGGFIDENYQKAKSSGKINANPKIDSRFVNISETSNLQSNKIHTNSDQLKETNQHQINSNLTFNFSNKSNLLGLDFQSRYSASEYLPDTKHEEKEVSGSLIIKMKRISDGNNEYIIDGSTKQSVKAVQKKASGIAKNIERYECHDCAEKFRTKRFLKSHVSEYHRGPYDSECEICHVKCKKSSGHKKHFLWCPKSVVHKCNSCDRTYCYRASLVKHLKTHQR